MADKKTLHLVYSNKDNKLKKVLINNTELEYVTAVKIHHNINDTDLWIKLSTYSYDVVHCKEAQAPLPTYEQLVGRGARIVGPNVLRVGVPTKLDIATEALNRIAAYKSGNVERTWAAIDERHELIQIARIALEQINQTGE
jgi:hypothetical protein